MSNESPQGVTPSAAADLVELERPARERHVPVEPPPARDRLVKRVGRRLWSGLKHRATAVGQLLTPIRNKRVLRWCLAALAGAILLASLWETVVISTGVSLNHGLKDLPYNEIAKQSIDARLDLSRSLFQLGLLLTGALWGLVIGKKDETLIMFSEAPESLMFVSASALLLISMCSHGLYVNNITGYLVDAAGSAPPPSEVARGAALSLPNIFDQNVNYLFVLQTVNLIGGGCTAVFTLISAHRLK